MSSADKLEKNILATLTYYDVMDYPMTNFEIFKYLLWTDGSQLTSGDNDFERYSLLDVINKLEEEKLKKFIEEYRGFYFLKGRKNLVEQRLERNKIAEIKFKILLKTVRWLRCVPYVRMIATTGSLAMKNTEKESDLDVLVVIEYGKIFIGRTLLTLAVHLLGRRRHGKKIANRICFNFFITDKSLEINLKDVFSASEYSFILPLFGFEVFQKFQKENSWIKKYKPNFQTDDLPNLKLLPDTRAAKILRGIGEKIFSFDFIENRLKRWQTLRIMKDPRTRRAGSMIIANDEMLVFLPEPQGPEIFQRFKEKLNRFV
jgi:predicted nucleotidyltransferase